MFRETEMVEAMQVIMAESDELALLNQLAEECMELGKAALKMARAEKLVRSPTDVTIPEARAQMGEEAGDVALLMQVLGISMTINRDKILRWAERLKKEEKV